jgi:hypothetical protein
LLTLRAEYISADDEPDHMRRIQVKNDLARSMGAEVLRTNIDRYTLVDQGDEVMTLALAGAVTALPQSGDDVLIMTAGPRVERLHVHGEWRVHLALGPRLPEPVVSGSHGEVCRGNRLAGRSSRRGRPRPSSLAGLNEVKQVEEFWDEETHSILDVDHVIAAEMTTSSARSVPSPRPS